MPHSVTVEAYSSQTANAVPSFSSGVAYSGRVVNRVKMIRDARGQEKVSNTTIYLNATAAIGPRDRITLPSGYTPQQPVILRVDRIPDEDGLHHTVIYA